MSGSRFRQVGAEANRAAATRWRAGRPRGCGSARVEAQRALLLTTMEAYDWRVTTAGASLGLDRSRTHKLLLRLLPAEYAAAQVRALARQREAPHAPREMTPERIARRAETLAALEAHGGNLTRAAKALRITRDAVRCRLRALAPERLQHGASV